MGYLEAHQLNRVSTHVLIWKIARAEECAWSLIPGYSYLVESKRASRSHRETEAER